MTNASNAPDIRVEILSTPAVKNMTVSQVGKNMFSIDMNILMVVRVPTESAVPDELKSSSTSGVKKVDAQPATYSDGTTPQSDGEAVAFDDFSAGHGYPPQTREVLAEWVKLQQGGA